MKFLLTVTVSVLIFLLLFLSSSDTEELDNEPHDKSNDVLFIAEQNQPSDVKLIFNENGVTDRLVDEYEPQNDQVIENIYIRN
jgi:hypothetical protein